MDEGEEVDGSPVVAGRDASEVAIYSFAASPGREGRSLLRSFQLFSFNTANVFEAYEPFEGAADADALGHADLLLRTNSRTTAIEIWEHGRFVARVPRP